MLGRLRLSIEETTKFYLTLMQEVPSGTPPASIKTDADGPSKLEQMMKAIVREATGDENAPMLDKRSSEDSCKTYAYTPSRDDTHD
jgi:hypothetical protein